MIRATPPNRPRPGLAALAFALCATILLGAPAAADLLVTRDGSVIETRGPWRVQGRLVIFELADGQLASMQLGEVDLDASRAAMEKAVAAAEKPPKAAPPEKKAVMVLTDADVRSAPPAADDIDEEAAEEAQATGSPPPAAQRLVVSSWEDTSGPDGVVITGELVNQSPDVAGNIGLGVLLYDREGEPLESVQATVTSQVLQPGQRARFRADVQGVFDFSALSFAPESLGLAVASEEAESPPGDEG